MRANNQDLSRLRAARELCLDVAAIATRNGISEAARFVAGRIQFLHDEFRGACQIVVAGDISFANLNCEGFDILLK